MGVPRRRQSRTAPGLAAARKAASQQRLEQRARLIGAGLEVLTRKRTKFNQVKATYNGQKYDSLGEAEYAAKLDLLLAAGKIRAWSRPTPFILLDGPKPRDRVTYKPDFLIEPLTDQPYYVDYKGSTVGKNGKRHTPTETQAFGIRVKMWRASQPAELRVVYSDGVEKVVAPRRAV